MISFHKQVEEYSLIWPQQTISTEMLVKQKSANIPLYRLNRLGQPIEALNVEWVGDIEIIRQSLLIQGWTSQPVGVNFPNIIKGFFESSAIYHMPIFPQLYHNKQSVILMTKNTGQDDTILILRLWASDINLSDSAMPLWIGSVNYYHPESRIFSLKQFSKKTPFVGATEILIKYLKNFKWQQIIYLQGEQPLEMAKLNWDGKLLIIQPTVVKKNKER